SLLVRKDAVLDGRIVFRHGAQEGHIWTATNNEGVGAWRPPQSELKGDAMGEMSDNRVDTLAGGTIQVTDLALKAEVESLEEIVNGHTTEIANLTTEVNAHSSQIINLTTEVNNHTTQITNLTTQVDTHSDQIEDLDDRVSNIEVAD